MLASMTWTQWLLSVVLICVCLFLMLVILLQRGRGGGISSAFGGGGGSGAFGAKTGDVFTWITCVVAGIFVILAVTANFAFQVEVPEPRTASTPGAAPTDQGEKTLIPIQLGEDGVALPINEDQMPPGQPGIKSVTITPDSKLPSEPFPAPATTPAPAPAQTGGAAKPGDATPPPTPTPEKSPEDSPKKEPGNP